VHNTFVVFPSWVLHEVLPVSCPTKQFIDSRFALNFWLWRRKPAPHI
jgi:SM-20-related protein